MKISTFFGLIVLILTLFIHCKKNNDDDDRCEETPMEVTETLSTCSESIMNTEIWKQVEQMPLFESCDTILSRNFSEWEKYTDRKIKEFLDENIVYPSCAVKNQIEGEVTLTFVVHKSGCLSRIGVIKDIGYGCGEEVQRVISTLPNWKIGKQRGQPVDVQIVVQYEFKL